MSLYIVFGLPGTGKSYVGRLFEKEFGFYLYDGDIDMPLVLRKTIEEKGVVTDKMRDEFFANIITKLKILQKKHQNIILSQTYIKEKYRLQVLAEFPDCAFVLVQTETTLREDRLARRPAFPIDAVYARKMCELFEAPQIQHSVIDNNIDGEESVKKQIKNLLFS